MPMLNWVVFYILRTPDDIIEYQSTCTQLDDASSNKLIASSNFFPLDHLYRFWDKNIPWSVDFFKPCLGHFFKRHFWKSMTVLHICHISWAEMNVVRNALRFDWKNSAIGVRRFLWSLKSRGCKCDSEKWLRKDDSGEMSKQKCVWIGAAKVVFLGFWFYLIFFEPNKKTRENFFLLCFIFFQ